MDKDEIVVTPGQLIRRKFLNSKLSIIGIGILVFLFVFSFIGPLFVSYGYDQVFFNNETSTIIPIQGPSFAHLLGIDQNGMDVLIRLMYGGRISLTIGFVVIFVEIIMGTILGGLAGYFGGIIDGVIMRIVDIVKCLPFIPIMLIVGAFINSLNSVDKRFNIYILMFVMGLIGWTGIARVVRGQVLSLKEQEFMIASEALGLSTKRKLFAHLIPNVMPQLIVITTMGLGSIILTEASLSFLGFGVEYPIPSWGNMITVARSQSIITNHWYLWVMPGLFILVTVLAFNFIGDGIRDAYDPKTRRAKKW